jgi:hypothetical protein
VLLGRAFSGIFGQLGTEGRLKNLLRALACGTDRQGSHFLSTADSLRSGSIRRFRVDRVRCFDIAKEMRHLLFSECVKQELLAGKTRPGREECG